MQNSKNSLGVMAKLNILSAVCNPIIDLNVGAAAKGAKCSQYATHIVLITFGQITVDNCCCFVAHGDDSFSLKSSFIHFRPLAD